MVKIKIKGLTSVNNLLNKLGKAVSDNKEFLSSVAVSEIKKEVSRVFSSKGFGGWPPLAPSTLRYKRRYGYSSDPLVRTGSMKGEMTSLSGVSITSNKLVYESNTPYAKYHEYGTSRIPARPVFSLAKNKLEQTLPMEYSRYISRRI